LRTFAPFVAGVAAMNRRQFALFNVAGAMLWVGIALGAGYAWGDEPFVKGNFGLVMVAVVERAGRHVDGTGGGPNGWWVACSVAQSSWQWSPSRSPRWPRR
jgi:hypothetical protein